MLKRVLVALALALTVAGCGYHRVQTGSSLPPYVKTIAVPTFLNSSLKYRVEQRFTVAVMDEILRRGRRLNVTSHTEGADAVLTGDIRRFQPQGTILDSQGRTRVWQITITVAVTLRDMKTRKIIYENPGIAFTGDYELSDDPQSFFNEENPAVDRIAKDFAQSIVTTIMEGM
jgi:outer membrane lipopolysaccharide assembly protein LptE/RlpB